MDAQVYQLDDMRSRHSSATSTAASSLMPLASDGLALLVSATSFWVEYVAAMALFHHRLLSVDSLPCSKPPKTLGRP